jgi:hypothetical protein
MTSQNHNDITIDGQSASLSWCPAPIWDPRSNILLLSLIVVRQLRVCWCGVPSLMRGRVCSFRLLLGIASAAFFVSESRGTHDHYLPAFYRERENINLGVIVRYTTLRWELRKQYLRFRKFPSSVIAIWSELILNLILLRYWGCIRVKFNPTLGGLR